MKNILASILFMILFWACDQPKEEQSVSINTINEKYQTARNENDNVDSPTFWKGKDGEAWLISTAKTTDLLIVNDASTGRTIMRFGSEGTEPGKFNRPNGIAVVEDFLFVVERDNHRVQVLTLPGFKSIGTFGDSLLVKPYGIFTAKEKNSYSIFVTDNYEFEKDVVPADALLGKRVQKYMVSIENNMLYSKFLGYIGETKGSGVLRVVESIYGDPKNNILLVAEEDTTRSAVKIYDLNGKFMNKSFGEGIFKGQIEGITLFEENDGGFWIITDQSYNENIFHIFERETFAHIGAFDGPKTTNTDGIWMTPQSFANFSDGAFFAVHNDGNVSAFDLAEIKKIIKKSNHF